MTPAVHTGTVVDKAKPAAVRSRAAVNAQVRKAVFTVHLWGGIVIGLYFVMLGLTGGLLVFARELDTTLNPHLKRSTPPAVTASFLPASASWETVRDAFPEQPVRRLELPRGANGVYEFRIGEEKATEREVFVDPYRGNILGDRLREGTFLRWANQLHTNLLLDKTGRTMNGYGALLLIALLATGIVLWWPSNGRQFAQRMTVKRGATGKRLLYDLHNVAGMYPLPILILITTTGAVFTFKEPVKAVVYTLTGTPLEKPEEKEKKEKKEKAEKEHGAKKGKAMLAAWTPALSIEEALLRSEEAAPGTHAVHMDLPLRPGDPYKVHRELPEGNRLGRKVKVYLDATTGAIVKSEDSRRDPSGKRLMDLNGPLHEGRWGGLASKILYAMIGVGAPLALFVTGLWKYLQTKRAQAANRAKRAAAGIK